MTHQDKNDDDILLSLFNRNAVDPGSAVSIVGDPSRLVRDNRIVENVGGGYYLTRIGQICAGAEILQRIKKKETCE